MTRTGLDAGFSVSSCSARFPSDYSTGWYSGAGWHLFAVWLVDDAARMVSPGSPGMCRVSLYRPLQLTVCPREVRGSACLPLPLWRPTGLMGMRHCYRRFWVLRRVSCNRTICSRHCLFFVMTHTASAVVAPTHQSRSLWEQNNLYLFIFIEPPQCGENIMQYNTWYAIKM